MLCDPQGDRDQQSKGQARGLHQLKVQLLLRKRRFASIKHKGIKVKGNLFSRSNLDAAKGCEQHCPQAPSAVAKTSRKFLL